MKNKKWRGKGVIVFGSMLAILLIIVAILGLGNPGNSKASAQAPKPSPTASAPSCTPAYQQVEVKHDGGKVDSEFAEKYAEATAKAKNLSDAQIKLLLEESGKNAQVLATWAHPFGLFSDPSKWPTLVANGCLSPEGQKLHNQFEGALKASGTKVTEGNADANGYNSGISNGTYGVDASRGVSGDRKAIQITLKDGTTFWIMVRCANPVYPGKPNLPHVPTDNPKCPWNPTLPPDSPLCHQPKDHKDDVTPPQGTTPLGSDPVQPIAPPAKADPLKPTTPVTANPGTPAPGASPAPVAPSPAPSIPQTTTPDDPGTPITDPDA